jgi:hypothetical protein
VGLRDGTAVAGWVYSYTVEPAEADQRELVLAKPVRIRAPGETEYTDARQHFFVVSGHDIRLLSVEHFRIHPVEIPGRFAGIARRRHLRKKERDDQRLRDSVVNALETPRQAGEAGS